MTNITHCPVCGGTQWTSFLECRDNTVSHETFTLVKCSNCNFTFTNPIPDLSQLGNYYDSPAYISHSPRPSSIIDRAYILARTQTLKWKIRNIKKYHESQHLDILDYGCGTGDFLNACKIEGWNITGIEPSSGARQIASAKNGDSIYSTIDDIHGSNFDVITLWHVLEHIPDFNPVIDTLNYRLNKSGTIFVAVPNRKSWDARHYHKDWAAYDVPRHLWHFTQDDIKKIMTAHSLNVIGIIPMKLDAYYVSLLSEKYKAGKSTPLTILKAVINGLRSNASAISTSEYSSLIYVIKK